MIEDPLARTLVAALFKEGWDINDIADELGLEVENVVEYCNKLV